MTHTDSGFRFLRYQLPAIAWGLMIFVSSSIPSFVLEFQKGAPVDKLVHFVVFFIFGWLLYRGLAHQRKFPLLRRHAKLFTIIIGVCYGVFDEVHQLFVRGRSTELLDVTADAAGVVGFVLVAWFLERGSRDAWVD
jgi:hypothetical protein